MPLTRISITVPKDLVTAADRRARELDRSRSWVVAEALRAWLRGRGPTTGEPEPLRATRVRERPAGYLTGLGEYRLAQLEADLALTPEQRVREAERTARDSERVAGRQPIEQIVFFDRYEDYLQWKRHRDLVP